MCSTVRSRANSLPTSSSSRSNVAACAEATCTQSRFPRPPDGAQHDHGSRVRRARRGAGSGVEEPAVGTRVVIDPDPKCGSCANCQRGMPSACLRLRAIGVYRDGGLAPRCRVPARAAFEISESVPASLAAIAEPLACVVHGVQRSAVQPGESALVFGGGSIGCMFAALLSSCRRLSDCGSGAGGAPTQDRAAVRRRSRALAGGVGEHRT